MRAFAALFFVFGFITVGVSSIDAKECKVVKMSREKTLATACVKSNQILASGYCCIGCNGQSTCGNDICVSCSGNIRCC